MAELQGNRMGKARRSRAEIEAERAARTEKRRRAAERKARLAEQQRRLQAEQQQRIKAMVQEAPPALAQALYAEEAKRRAGKRPSNRLAFTPSAEKLEIRDQDVVDPYETDKTIVASVNVRESPLSHLWARGMIDNGQRAAGDRFRRIYERSMVGGARAIDYEKAKVDGGKLYNPMHEGMHEAAKEMKQLRGVLGLADYQLMVKVAGEGQAIKDVAAWWHMRTKIAVTEGDEKYVGKRVRDGLTTLAEHWGLVANGRERRRERA